jgi:hypothetical protein
VEAGVYEASVDLHDALGALHIPHLWHDYGPGCHTAANFEHELADTFQAFTTVFAHPPAPPASFDYASIEPDFDIWGWHVSADPQRALEFLRLDDVSAGGLTLTGSGTTTVTTPPLFRGLRRVDVGNAEQATAAPDADGHVRFTVDLGAPDGAQQDTPGAATRRNSRTVTFAPHAVVELTRIRATRRRVRVCGRAIAGPVAARMRVRGATRSTSLTLTSTTACRALHRTRRPTGTRGTLLVTGEDRFGHRVEVRRTIRLPVLRRRSR